MLCRLPSSQHISSCIGVILLTLFTGPAIATNFDHYQTEASKGAACAKENNIVGPFHIPNNQCSGVIYNLTQHCERLEWVKVSVADYAHVILKIDDSLDSATIERVPNIMGECPGRATVRVALGCGPSMPGRGRPNDDAYILPPL